MPNIFSETLARITRSSTLSAGVLDDAAIMIAKEGCSALGAQRVGMWRVSGDMSMLKCYACYDKDKGTSFIQRTINISNCTEYLEILLNERQFVVNDAKIPNALSPALGAFGPNVCAFVDSPIYEGGKLVGVVCVEQHHCDAFPGIREWTIEEQNFVSSLADFMSIAIEGVKRHEQICRAETLLNTLPGMAYRCVAEPSDFKYLFISEGCLALTGYTAEELKSGKINFYDRLHPEDVLPVKKQIRETIAAGMPFESTYRIITKDGTVKWIWERSRVVEFNPDGTPHVLEGFDTDVTERQRLKDTEKERERVRIMLDATPLVCSLWNKDFRIIDCNQETLNLYEVSKEEYKQKFFELAPPFQPDGQNSRSKGRSLIETTFKKGKYTVEWMSQKLDGTLIPLEVTLTRVAYGNEDVVVVHGRDLRSHHQMMENISYRDNLLSSVNQVATLLLDVNDESCIESQIVKSMEIIARSVGAERVNVWKNEVSDDISYHVNIYSWCSEERKKGAPVFVGMRTSPDKDWPHWKDRLMNGECINGPISKMSPSDQAFLGAYDMKSTVIIPLFLDNYFWGLFSLDSYIERTYTEEEINILWSVSLMVANTIYRHSLHTEIAETQKRVRMMFDTTPLGASLWDENFNQIEVNLEMIKLFGLKDKQEYFDRFFDLSPEYQPDGSPSLEFALGNLKKAFRDGCHQFEHLHQKLDGTPLPTEIKLFRIQTDKGYIIAGYIRDLRPRKKLLADIHKANERAMLMLDTSPLGVQVLDRNFHTVDCNEAAVRLYGFKNKQEYIDRFFETCQPEYQPDGQRSDEKVAMYVNKAFEEGYCIFDWMHQMPDGTPVPTEVSLVRVQDSDGDIVIGYTRDLREYNRMVEKINYQNVLLTTVNRISTILLEHDTNKFESQLLEAMGMMARAVDADRAYIWKNHDKNGQLHCTQIYEWSENEKSQQHSQYTVDVSYADSMPSLAKALPHGKCINGLVRDMLPVEQAQLVPQGILSVIVVPIFLNAQFWGFVGFDDCHKERIFTEQEELILRSASRMIANALIRNDMTHELHTTATLLGTVISNYPGIIWCSDRNSIITLFDGARVRQLGLLPDSVVGKRLNDIPPSLTHSEIVDYVEKAYAEGAQDWVVKTDKTVYHMRTVPIHDDDGNITGIVGSADDITALAQLQDDLEIAVMEANEANKKMNRTLHTMESIMNNTGTSIYVSDPSTKKILFVNDRMKKTFGIEGDDVTGKYCYKLFRGFDDVCEFCPCHQLDKEPDQTIVKEEYFTDLQRYFRRADCYINWPTGDKVHLQYTYDITELVATREQAQQSSRSKGEFLAKMSHEIRTPMNAIVGMTELALREDLPRTVHDHIITVKQAGVNLLAIINDILDFSKIESGNMQIIPASYCLSSLINDVVSIIRMRAIDSHIRFVVYLDSNLPNFLIGDETRIRQILVNLLGNAVKYTDKGNVSLVVCGTMTDESTISLTMEVKDSGRGIKKENIEKLFDSFSQFDTELNKGVEGVGLGLAISGSIIKAMGGEITVESEYGKGSTFSVTIPQTVHQHEKLATVDNLAETTALVYERRVVYSDSIVYAINSLGVKCEHVSSTEQFHERTTKDSFSFIFVSHSLFEQCQESILQFAAKSRIVLLAEFGEVPPLGPWSVLYMPVHAISIANVFNGVSDNFSYNTSEEQTARFTAPDAKVLIVDDISTNLKVVNGLLLPYKMEVNLCNSGAEAINTIQSKDYDIVFMDHRMPGMDGVETTKRIRALGNAESPYKNLPIVALTANAVSGMREMFLQNGFNDFLSKPIDTVQLNTILEKWIPQEKQQGLSIDSAILRNIAANTHEPPPATFAIAGLNTTKGIHLSGGTVEYYRETIATFYTDGLQRKEEIRKCLDEGNLSRYTIHVHALKGASANIGADDLSKAAHALEVAGQQGDLAFIQSNNDHFLTMLTQILGSINNTLSSHHAHSDQTDSGKTEQFRAELVQLKSALENMDFEKINRTVDLLLGLAQTDNIQTTVRNISKHILLFEYAEADTLIESLLPENF